MIMKNPVILCSLYVGVCLYILDDDDVIAFLWLFHNVLIFFHKKYSGYTKCLLSDSYFCLTHVLAVTYNKKMIVQLFSIYSYADSCKSTFLSYTYNNYAPWGHPKWDPIPYKVHYFWPGPVRLCAKLLHYLGNRVSFSMPTGSLLWAWLAVCCSIMQRANERNVLGCVC